MILAALLFFQSTGDVFVSGQDVYPTFRIPSLIVAPKGRVRMTVKLSRDEGKTWSTFQELGEGPAAYSCLALLNSRSIGCLYERGDTSPYEKIVLARIPLE
jgi:hypothetical protein